MAFSVLDLKGLSEYVLRKVYTQKWRAEDDLFSNVEVFYENTV